MAAPLTIDAKKAKKRVSSLVANYKKWTESRHPLLDFIIDETDVGKWWVRIRDLQEDEFLGGEYILQMIAPKEYPFGPPEFYFKTANGVYGCDSKVCLSIGEFHKDGFAAGQGGMGGFASQLINGIVFWQDLGPGISILHEEFQRLSDNNANKRGMVPGIKTEHLELARRSRDANYKRFPELSHQFDSLPLNLAYNAVRTLPHSSKVQQLIRNYITVGGVAK